MPLFIKHRVINFLINRRQVKLADILSGVPQGTKLRPWLFLLMINDLWSPQVQTWKLQRRSPYTTSVKGAGQKIGRTDYVPVANLRLSKGWALKKTKAAVRISSGVKEFLTNLFNKGAKDLHQKAMPADVVEQIKETFPVSEWIEVQTEGTSS